MRRFTAAVVLSAIGFAASAQEKPTVALKPAPLEPIAKLIEKLGNRDYKTREAASKSLEARGVEALPELRKALESTTSAEVRKRLQTMVQNLERVQILSPKRLTVKMKDRPVAEIIREIERQTGYHLQFQGGNNVMLTVEMENATFWEVIDNICNSAGLQMNHYEGQGMIFYQTDSYWPFVCYSGPFKVIASNFNYNKTANLGPVQRNPALNQVRNESLTFSFQISSEPKLPMMNIGQPRLIEAIDELGNSMKPEANLHEVSYSSYSSYRTYQHGGSVNLVWPNKEARTVKRLRCSVPVTLLAEQKPEIIVDDILHVKNKKFTGSTAEVQVEDVKEPNKTQYHVKLTVRNLAANAGQDYNWANSVHQRVELQDAKGNKYFSQGYNWENSSPGHVQATFMFGNNGNATLGPPVRLVYNRWELMQHNVEFEFKNLMLP